MKATDPHAYQVPGLIARGELKAEEYVSAMFDAIATRDRKVHAYLQLNGDEAVARAREIDRKVKRGDKLGKLGGLGIAVKDNICVAGMQATCGSKILEGFVPPYSATVIQRIVNEDGIILGKVNMDEFAMGNTTETSAFGPTLNPWDTTRVPGGSSGGSAAAVADGTASLALGSDTGGSVRCPASFCSVVGLKPTYGSVSRYGLIPYANSLEQVGPIGRSARDVKVLLDVIAGRDPLDATTSSADKDRTSSYGSDSLRGIRVGRVREYFATGVQESVKRMAFEACSKLEELGAEVRDASLGSLPFSLAVYYIIATAEASSNLSRYDGVRYGASLQKGPADWNSAYAKTRSECFGEEVKRRILMGTFVLSAGYYEAYYVRAQKVRALLMREFDEAFKRFDVLLGPTMPILPPKVGERVTPLEDYLMDINTVSANLTGLPAVSVPCGRAGDLPVGVQLTAPRFGEGLLLHIAESFESNFNTEVHPAG